jgi:mannose-6-phosphate isomerase
MSNSDNVLRGGLTPKRVDLDELFFLLNFESDTGTKAPQEVDHSGCLNVITPASDFMLGLFKKGSYAVEGEAVVELLFCSEGEALLTHAGEAAKIKRGECLVVSASLSTYKLEVKGCLFRATLPSQRRKQ